MRTESLRYFRMILQKKRERIEKRLEADPETRMKEAEAAIKEAVALRDPVLPGVDSVDALVFKIAANKGLASQISEYQSASQEFKNLERHRDEWGAEFNALGNDIEALDEMIDKAETPLLHQEEGVRD